MSYVNFHLGRFCFYYQMSPWDFCVAVIHCHLSWREWVALWTGTVLNLLHLGWSYDHNVLSLREFHFTWWSIAICSWWSSVWLEEQGLFLKCGLLFSFMIHNPLSLRDSILFDDLITTCHWGTSEWILGIGTEVKWNCLVASLWRRAIRQLLTYVWLGILSPIAGSWSSANFHRGSVFCFDDLFKTTAWHS